MVEDGKVEIEQQVEDVGAAEKREYKEKLPFYEFAQKLLDGRCRLPQFPQNDFRRWAEAGALAATLMTIANCSIPKQYQTRRSLAKSVVSIARDSEPIREAMVLATCVEAMFSLGFPEEAVESE